MNKPNHFKLKTYIPFEVYFFIDDEGNTVIDGVRGDDLGLVSFDYDELRTFVNDQADAWEEQEVNIVR